MDFLFLSIEIGFDQESTEVFLANTFLIEVDVTWAIADYFLLKTYFCCSANGFGLYNLEIVD